MAVLLGAAMAASCRKDNYTQMPSVPVNITININNPSYSNLQVSGGWVYVTGGIEGIILYRRDSQVINAFDRLSPYQPERYCRVFVDSSDVFAVDTCSNSKFLLYDGSANSGPANQPLLQYATTFNGTTLTVTN